MGSPHYIVISSSRFVNIKKHITVVHLYSRTMQQSSSKPSNDWQLFNYLIISKMHTGQIQILAIYSLSAKSAPMHLPDLETFQIHLKCQGVNHILQFFLLKPLRNLFL